MSALGNPHSRDHFIVIHAVCLFAGLNQIDFDGHDNCTYRKANCAQAQSDVSFYLGANAETVPWEVTIISKVSSCWFIPTVAVASSVSF